MRLIACMLLFLTAFIVPDVGAQTKSPQDAQEILAASLKEAGKSGRPVFLIFHASWCVWCHRLDAAIESTELRQIFEKSYVITRLDVMESARGKIDSLENPGGRELMARFGGEKSGLPYYALLDSAGNKLADSDAMPGGNNIGYPGSKEEITAFGKLLQSTAPSMSEMDRTTVLAYLTAHSPH